MYVCVCVLLLPTENEHDLPVKSKVAKRQKATELWISNYPSAVFDVHTKDVANYIIIPHVQIVIWSRVNARFSRANLRRKGGSAGVEPRTSLKPSKCHRYYGNSVSTSLKLAEWFAKS